jgi:glyoxylate/hydroxypyruvate reductase
VTRILVASYLEPECVERIRTKVPQVDVGYEPELLPRPRYRGDHDGNPDDGVTGVSHSLMANHC